MPASDSPTTEKGPLQKARLSGQVGRLSASDANSTAAGILGRLSAGNPWLISKSADTAVRTAGLMGPQRPLPAPETREVGNQIETQKETYLWPSTSRCCECIPAKRAGITRWSGWQTPHISRRPPGPGSVPQSVHWIEDESQTTGSQ